MQLRKGRRNARRQIEFEEEETVRITSKRITNRSVHGLDMAQDIAGKIAPRIQHPKITPAMNHLYLEEVVVEAEVSEEAVVDEALAEVSVEVEAITTTMAMVPQVEGTNTQVREAEVNKEQVVPIKAKITTIKQIIISIILINNRPMEIGTMCIIKMR